MPPRPPPKTVPGNRVSTRASLITHDAPRIYGVQWRSKIIEGKVISSCKRIPEGQTRNQTFVTADWYLPSRVVTKELNGRVIEFVPDAQQQQEGTPPPVAHPATPDNHRASANVEMETPSTTNTSATDTTNNNPPSSSSYTPSTATTATTTATPGAGSTTDTDQESPPPLKIGTDCMAHES